MIAILGQNDADFKSGSSWERQTLDWNAASAQIETTLSPAQLTAWKAVAVHMQYYTEVVRAANDYRDQPGSKP